MVSPERAGELRVATFNVSMYRESSGGLLAALETGEDPQIRKVAEVIQRNAPDILLLNEFDHAYSDGVYDVKGMVALLDAFRANYLSVPQAEGVEAVSYPYHFVAPCNTGLPSGMDLNNNGSTTDPADGFGYGVYPGEYAMVLLSKYPIRIDGVRTFRFFRWKDMPGAYLPEDPQDSDGDGETRSFFNAAELELYRLSSKSHWDVPFEVNGHLVHLLASHPTPPVFDDGEALRYPGSNVSDWNGLRNHDEIRFWADYIDPEKSAYIYDDAEWFQAGRKPPSDRTGGLGASTRFIILGDQNCDPVDGSRDFNGIRLLLNNPLVDSSMSPSSDGAREQVNQGQSRPEKTADFILPEEKTASFNLRADYVLPSRYGFALKQAYVFWPTTADPLFPLLEASDHRMVVVDLDLEDRAAGASD